MTGKRIDNLFELREGVDLDTEVSNLEDNVLKVLRPETLAELAFLEEVAQKLKDHRNGLCDLKL